MTSRQEPEAQGDLAAALAAQVVNMRDFGGLPTQDGRRVITGKLFRSGHLGSLGDAGKARLDAERFAVVADLRFAKERAEDPTRWQPNGAQVLKVEGGEQREGPHLAVLKSLALSAPEIDRFYCGFYRAIAFDEQFRPLFGRIITAMATRDGPTLIHCSVGKDRTGILVALIHTALGVTPEAIRADFMSTRSAPGIDAMIPEITARMKDRLKREISPDIARKMLGVEEAYLLAAFTEIADQCGSVERYLELSGADARTLDLLRRRLLV